MIVNLMVDSERGESVSYEQLQQIKQAIRALGHNLEFIVVDDAINVRYMAELSRLRGPG
jgi:hypothetical protein